LGGIAAYCQPENKVALDFVEGLNNKIRVLQRRAYGLRDEEYLRPKILTTMLPPSSFAEFDENDPHEPPKTQLSWIQHYRSRAPYGWLNVLRSG
jgi:hypothetical protein